MSHNNLAAAVEQGGADVKQKHRCLVGCSASAATTPAAGGSASTATTSAATATSHLSAAAESLATTESTAIAATITALTAETCKIN